MINESLCTDFTKLLNYIPIQAYIKESLQLSLSILPFIGSSLLCFCYNIRPLKLLLQNVSISIINPLHATRYWKMLEASFLHKLPSFGTKMFQCWSHIHSICCLRDKFWATIDPVEDNGNKIVFWIIDLLLVKLKWWLIFKFNLIIVCYSKGGNESLSHL